MLRVARIADRTGRYYLTALEPELDAPAHGREGPASGGRRWLGDGAAALGLHGGVAAGPLGAVLSGRHPFGNHSLRLRETAVSAYDLTFAAPKSVSALFALSEPGCAAAVLAAHREAVDAAVDYVARHAATVRSTTAEGRTTGPAEGLVAACFTHAVSRSLDPHLHSHVVVANLAHGEDGRWRAMDGRGLYAHAQAAGAVYDAALRHGVTGRLGVEWAPRGPRGWEIAGVDPVLLGALSSRRAEILAHLARRPGRSTGTARTPSRRARTVAWAATRDPKGPVPALVELRARWASVARDVGASLELVLGGRTRRPERADLDEHRFSAGISEVGDRGVSRRDAIAAWARALDTGAAGSDLARCVDALAEWGDGTGIAERCRPPAAVVPPTHVLRVLGPRPASPERLLVWLSAASSIARYRARWDVRDRWSVLGAEGRAELSALPPRRLAHHLATRREIDDALSRLGRRREHERDRERRREVSRDVVLDSR